MKISNMLVLYRMTLGMTQKESAASLGITQPQLSKYEVSGPPTERHRFILDKILPTVEDANMKAVCSAINGAQRPMLFLEPDFTILAVSQSMATMYGGAPADIIGQDRRALIGWDQLEDFYTEATKRGIFEGNVLAGYARGIKIADKALSSRNTPVGLDREGSRGVWVDVRPSSTDRVDAGFEIQEAFA